MNKGTFVFICISLKGTTEGEVEKAEVLINLASVMMGMPEDWDARVTCLSYEGQKVKAEPGIGRGTRQLCSENLLLPVWIGLLSKPGLV